MLSLLHYPKRSVTQQKVGVYNSVQQQLLYKKALASHKNVFEVVGPWHSSNIFTHMWTVSITPSPHLPLSAQSYANKLAIMQASLISIKQL